MSAWPATLPRPKLGLTDTEDESRLITPMDAGPASVRNRFTAVTRTIAIPMTLTGVQRAAFEVFFQTTLNHGTEQFDWTDPVDNGTVSMRFKTKPTWTLIVPGLPDDRIWSGVLNLEILP